MNKRKKKKQLKKCFCPLADEFGLLTMTQEEILDFRKEMRQYSLRHFSYKHYKDKEKARKRALQHPTIYAPVGKQYADEMIQMAKLVRGYDIKPIIVEQNISQLTLEPFAPQKNALALCK